MLLILQIKQKTCYSVKLVAFGSSHASIFPTREKKYYFTLLTCYINK
jgi:hypothetical protein